MLVMPDDIHFYEPSQGHGLPHDPLRLHLFYAKVYLVLAVILLIKNWRQTWELRKGFKV